VQSQRRYGLDTPLPISSDGLKRDRERRATDVSFTAKRGQHVRDCDGMHTESNTGQPVGQSPRRNDCKRIRSVLQVLPLQFYGGDADVLFEVKFHVVPESDLSVRGGMRVANKSNKRRCLQRIRHWENYRVREHVGAGKQMSSNPTPPSKSSQRHSRRQKPRKCKPAGGPCVNQ
jgi:hypothetical protein